jgi:hypothetical protein
MRCGHSRLPLAPVNIRCAGDRRAPSAAERSKKGTEQGKSRGNGLPEQQNGPAEGDPPPYIQV